MKTKILLLTAVTLCMLGACKKDPGGGNNTNLRPYSAGEKYFAGTIRHIGLRHLDMQGPNFPNDTVRVDFFLGGKYILTQNDSKQTPYGRVAYQIVDTFTNKQVETYWAFDSAKSTLKLGFIAYPVYDMFNDSFYMGSLSPDNSKYVMQKY